MQAVQYLRALIAELAAVNRLDRMDGWIDGFGASIAILLCGLRQCEYRLRETDRLHG